MPKKVFRFAYALNFVFQVGITMVCPAALFIFCGWYLTEHLGVGRWAMIVGIVLGVLTGVYSMFRFIMKAYIDPTQKEGKDNGATR